MNSDQELTKKIIGYIKESYPHDKLVLFILDYFQNDFAVRHLNPHHGYMVKTAQIYISELSITLPLQCLQHMSKHRVVPSALLEYVYDLWSELFAAFNVIFAIKYPTEVPF